MAGEVAVAKSSRDRPLVPSILDRLIDEQPGLNQEPEKNRHQVMAGLRISVRRDLENLLNTRCRCMGWPAELTELQQSLVGYGIPDIAGQDLGAAFRRKRFLKEVEDIIRTFEPRFRKVRLIELDNPDSIDRTLRFRIEAVLDAYPAPEPIVFDSALEPVSKTFSVKGGQL